MTDRLIVAQAVAFFIAGFFTSSNSMSHLLYELALNPRIQEKVRTEIAEELARTNGELEYDGVKKMDYLDAVFKGKFELLINYAGRTVRMERGEDLGKLTELPF